MSTIECPSCRSERIWKDGIRYTRNGDVQRYLCRECGYRFSETSWNGSDDPEYVQRIHREPLNTHPRLFSNRQICVTQPTGAKNLVEVESRIEKWAAGATKVDEATVKGKIVEYLWWMKKQGYKPRTIEFRVASMQRLIRLGANILDVESVKETIAKTDSWCETTKFHACNTYTNFLEFLGSTWKKPKYKPNKKFPFIPTEREIDQLIAHCGNKTATALTVAKETGARIGEILRLRWINIDAAHRTLSFEAEKGSNARMLNVSPELIAMLLALPKKNDYVFGTPSGHGDPKSYAGRLAITRKLCARKLGNPRIKEITFHTLRHWKGTLEYHKTKDIWHVKKVLGHKSITNTEIYIHIEKAKFKETNDEFIVKAVDELEEAKKLVEVGFEYVTSLDGYKLFKKRK